MMLPPELLHHALIHAARHARDRKLMLKRSGEHLRQVAQPGLRQIRKIDGNNRVEGRRCRAEFCQRTKV